MKPSDILFLAMDLIDRKGWEPSRRGLRTGLDSVEAIWLANPKLSSAYFEAMDYFRHQTAPFIYDWNDSPDRDLADVFRAFWRAIEIAKREGR